ncbi:hypothetical protein JKP88DRAFT_353216 [Tribonema minus]|uniref:sn-1-specific diacylglycerol lipase n=1 Tax=Tribonema minus TaxID=303371 RepID=A0A835Z9C7_9STRA|nr:hypothetical protein JKP88DRAFT_353216 [Tribonema minus]
MEEEKKEEQDAAAAGQAQKPGRFAGIANLARVSLIATKPYMASAVGMGSEAARYTAGIAKDMVSQRIAAVTDTELAAAAAGTRDDIPEVFAGLTWYEQQLLPVLPAEAGTHDDILEVFAGLTWYEQQLLPVLPAEAGTRDNIRGVFAGLMWYEQQLLPVLPSEAGTCDDNPEVFAGLTWYKQQLLPVLPAEGADAAIAAATAEMAADIMSQFRPRKVGDVMTEEDGGWSDGPAELVRPVSKETLAEEKAAAAARPDSPRDTPLVVEALRSENADSCNACARPFGTQLYRHHCRHCGLSFCHDHSPHYRPLLKFRLRAPQRVCSGCNQQLDLEACVSRMEWRMARCVGYIAGSLPPYFETGVESDATKAWRVAGGALFVAKNTPGLGTTFKVSAEVTEVLMKHGMQGLAGLLLRKEFAEAAELLRAACSALPESNRAAALSVGTAHELTAALYYLLAKRRGQRGAAPDAEEQEHQLPGCAPVDEETIAFVTRFAGDALHAMYDRTPVELQVLCKLRGWSLLFTHPESEVNRPAFALLADSTSKTAVVVVRGTNSLQDIVTDIKHTPIAFPSPDTGHTSSGARGGLQASRGMASSAQWIRQEVEPMLQLLHLTGHKIILTGHSLGAGVSSLLGALLRPVFPDVLVLGLATPACCSAQLADACRDFVTTVVLHDDVIPRLTPGNVGGLLVELTNEEKEWEGNFSEDWNAVVARAKGFWAPRYRTGAMRPAPVSPTPAIASVEAAHDNASAGAADSSEPAASDKETQLVPASPGGSAAAAAPTEQAPSAAAAATSRIAAGAMGLASSFKKKVAAVGTPSGAATTTWGPTDVKATAAAAAAAPPPVPPRPLPPMFVPGKVVHIYSYMGTYRAALVPADHSSLRRIEVYANCVQDHSAATYYNALCEVKDARAAVAAGRTPPQWVPFDASDKCQWAPFDASDKCQCCDSDFTWASTSSSKAQGFRDRHNCRKCGALVCGPCSSHSKALPTLGITTPVRICDRCYHSHLHYVS